MMYHDGWGPGAWIAVAFLMLVFWAVVVGAIVAVVRSDRTRRGGEGQPPANDAERILAERFARGEIDDDEYTRRRDLLRAR